jgi:oligosaccharide reducing-end xylanase
MLGAAVLGLACGDPDDNGPIVLGTDTGGASSTGGASGSGGATDTGGAEATGGAANPDGPRAACAAPARYRNLFVEILGKTPSEVDAKVKDAVQQLFHGSGDQPIYYEMGADQAYILDVNNDDIRSEGVSYGMFIAVSMGMKTEFDKLWRFAVARMRQPNGLLAWQLDTSGGVISPYAAPDGEEYSAMALLLASRRWGDDTGTHYGDEARAVMHAMATQGEFNPNPAVVTFGPTQTFTDASYVLPLFYSEWACVDSAHASLWKSATTYARTFFQAATHATTGLAPDHSEFDGSPQSGSNFGADAWRVPMNVMMDHHLNRADPWQETYAERLAAFWNREGLASYGNKYTVSGSRLEDGHGAGLAGVNAMLAFALPDVDGRPLLQAAWDVPVPTGQYRYYDGCLYLLSMLHLGGQVSLFY